jgi:hypothetical protein
MELPDNFSRIPEWPEALPLPPASKPVTVIEMPERGITYGSFKSTLGDSRIYTDFELSLGGGWKKLSRGVFVKTAPYRLLLVSVKKDEPGGYSRAFVLLKNLDQ